MSRIARNSGKSSSEKTDSNATAKVDSSGYYREQLITQKKTATTVFSMWWLVALYIIHSMGELCLSPIGLSMVSKLAPLRLSSLMMGTWFLANAAANKFAGTLSALIPPTVDPASTEPLVYPSIFGIQITNLYEFFMLFIVMTAVAAGILFLLSAWLEKMIKEKHEDVPVDIDRV